MGKYPSSAHTLLLTAAVLLLQACGGGGGDSQQPNVTFTSSSTATSSAISVSSATSSSAAPVTSLTISGVLGAEALANAPVEVSVGTQTFSAVADAQQKYQVALNVTEANQTAPIEVSAQGLNSDTWVKLASLLPSISRAKTLAGADNILDAREFIGVNLNPMSTVEYALTKGYSTTLTKDAERQAGLQQITAQYQINLASTLTLLLNDIDYNLPKQSANTLDFMLNSNARDTYVNILAGTDLNNNLLTDSRLAIEADTQQMNGSTTALEGTYVLTSSRFTYLMQFNKDGSGSLQTISSPATEIIIASDKTPFHNIAFSWVKKLNKVAVNFAAQEYYGTRSTGASNKILFNGLTLTLLRDNDDYKLVNTQLEIDDTLNGRLINTEYYAILRNLNQSHAVTEKDVIGKEWYASAYSYRFNDSHTVDRTSLANGTVETSNWGIENNSLVFNAGKSRLWLRMPLEAGFGALIADEANGTISNQRLVARTPLNLTLDEVIGRWTLANGFYDFNSNGVYGKGGTEAKSTWALATPSTLTSVEDGSFRAKRDVLAKVDNRYYSSYCSNNGADTLLLTSCLLETAILDKTFGGNTFWNSRANPVFQDQNNAVWRFYSASAVYVTNAETSTSKYLRRVAPNKFYTTNENTILELLPKNPLSTADAEICEYEAFTDCSQGTRFSLTRGIEIGLPKSQTGGLLYTPVEFGFGSSYISVNNSVMIPKGISTEFKIAANTGYQLGAISGCDGVLNGNFYTVPARTTTCDISVSFVAL